MSHSATQPEDLANSSQQASGPGKAADRVPAVPRNLLHNRKLQALARKHGITVDPLRVWHGSYPRVIGRVVAEKDYPQWCQIVETYWQTSRQSNPLFKAVAGTPYETFFASMNPETNERFKQVFFNQLVEHAKLNNSGLSISYQWGAYVSCLVEPVTFFGKSTAIRYGRHLSLVAFVRQVARANTPAECIDKWRKEIAKDLDRIVTAIIPAVSALPEFCTFTSDEIHNLLVRDNTLYSFDPAELANIVAEEARRRIQARELAEKVRAEQAHSRKLADQHGEFDDYLQCFPLARQQKRRVLGFLGPTNSGKTWQAIDRLAQAANGMYLGPLRLLALEQQEALEERGVRCSLITGEERILNSTTHFSCTIEVADFNTRLDVAVIDEMQMVLDSERGWAWVAAYCGLSASEILITGSAAALPALRVLARICGDDLQIQWCSRQGTLEMIPVVEPASLPRHSAVICFSRQMVTEVREGLQACGFACSSIYGDLSPEVRREEARRFREGETDIVVATDAIGMGMNLPIQCVAFWETDKFDGDEYRGLTTAEIHQIAGRAGRGIDGCGSITAFSEEDHQTVSQALAQPVPEVPVTELDAAPTHFHLETIARTLNEQRLDILLAFFVERVGFKDILRPKVPKNVRQIARVLDEISIAPSVGCRFRWSHAPLDPDNKTQMPLFRKWYRLFSSGQTCPAPEVSWESTNLAVLESEYAKLRLYRWLGQHFPDQFADHETVDRLIVIVNERVLACPGHPARPVAVQAPAVHYLRACHSSQ